MTGAGLSAARKAARPAPSQTNDPVAAAAAADAFLLADSTAIINYIIANAVVTTNDAQGGTNTGTVV
jgi:hypothetical protein